MGGMRSGGRKGKQRVEVSGSRKLGWMRVGGGGMGTYEGQQLGVVHLFEAVVPKHLVSQNQSS